MPKKDSQDDMFSLEPILDYEMTDQEAKAYKVCLIWMKMCNKVLPDYKYTTLPKNGDPRKCHLFRVVWKLLRETKGIVKDEELAHYIRAQLEILKGIKRESGAHVLIDPICLTGEKAWVRWQIWRRKFEASSRAENQRREVEERTPLYKIAKEIDKTRAFFSRYYDPLPTQEQVTEMITNKNLKRWVMLGKVSLYYVLHSPYCRNAFHHLKLSDYFSNIDLALYANDITPESHTVFRARFPHEFSN